MFHLNINFTEEPVLTIVPRYVMMELKEFFDKNKISYETILWHELPDGSKCTCTYKGKEFSLRRIMGLRCHISEEDVYRLAQELEKVKETE